MQAKVVGEEVCLLDDDGEHYGGDHLRRGEERGSEQDSISTAREKDLLDRCKIISNL